jgi:hypothetical protein
MAKFTRTHATAYIKDEYCRLKPVSRNILNVSVTFYHLNLTYVYTVFLCAGFGTNETALISILANRNEAQRKLVRLAYKEIYHQDLIQQLKSELSGNFEVEILQYITLIFYKLKKS